MATREIPTHSLSLKGVDIRDGDRVPRFRRVNADEYLATMPHGLSSCGEDWLDLFEPSSKAQSRASYPGSADMRFYDALLS